jgi:hypothetical protein
MLRLAAVSEQLWLAGNITEGRRWLDEALASATDLSDRRTQRLTVRKDAPLTGIPLARCHEESPSTS